MKVFRRAFWRTPAAEDRILHAERREWADDEGVARWDWFLEVEPSAELRNWLQQDNPFALVSTEGEQARDPDHGRATVVSGIGGGL